MRVSSQFCAIATSTAVSYIIVLAEEPAFSIEESSFSIAESFHFYVKLTCRAQPSEVNDINGT